jgi:benzoyl-CoA reductase/2-hydroxyglutaryl-CoA dehydratase subunit BcrC/BadD/HgdB
MTNPAQISLEEWHHRFKDIPDERVEKTRYYRHLPDAGWSQYLFPPSTHLVYGNRLLRKLKFDNSPAALRLWGFALSEGERIYRARQAGMKVIAVMGDLGAVPPLVYSFPNTVAFYPDCLWWTPFLMESKVLFDEAARFGMGEDCCFVRAALGAFSKKAYFPRPDFCIGTAGATCDDMAAVMSEAERLGTDVHYFELPHRGETADKKQRLISYLADGYRGLAQKLGEITGASFCEESFRTTLKKVNLVRTLIAEIKQHSASGSRNPMGALEMLNAEFSALSYYGDLDECLEVLREFRDTVKDRAQRGIGYDGQDLRLVWVTPPADPLLLNYAEELGGRIVGTEYLIQQSIPHIRGDGDPFTALAEGHVHSTLMGSTRYRVELVLERVLATGADGVIISGVFASTHCPYETAPIIKALRERGIPGLSFDVVAPGKIRLQSQVYNRMESFMESLRTRKKRRAG